MIYGADPYTPVLPSKPGFGHTVPAGLEAIIEYNGLFMNINRDVELYKINSIDGLWDADVADLRDPNNDDDGEQPLNSWYRGRTLVINGTIWSHSVKKMRQMQQDLKTAFADIRHEKPMRFRMHDSTLDHFIMVKKIAPISGIEQQVNFKAWRDFQISVRASNPRFLSESTQKITADGLENNIAEWNPDMADPLPLFSPQNLGNFDADTVIRVYGPATKIKITNEDQTTFFSVGSIPSHSGSYLEYDSAANSLVNEHGANQWNKLGDDSSLIRLVRGTNNFYYVGDSPKVTISWRHSWM